MAKREISETRIRQAIWMLKTNKTKKSICEHLGIAYSTKRLETVITEFKEKQERLAKLKKKARATSLTQDDKDNIISSYEEGESMVTIAERLYLTSPRIKEVLLSQGVPIRSRKKRGAAQVDHIVQDLEVKFKENDKVFVYATSEFGIIDTVYDEEWIEYHSESYRARYVELNPLADARKKWGDDFEGKEDIHWNIYWDYDNGESWKSQAAKREIARHQENIAECGRESYLLRTQGDYSHVRELPRHELFPIKQENGS